MSYTTLEAIEKCPLSWSLLRASYTEFPTYNGYPEKVRLATIAGQAVHVALERITSAVAHAGCRSTTGADVVPVLREMGGLSKVLRDALEDVCAKLWVNPRVRHRVGDLASALDRETPGLRERLQALLGAVGTSISLATTEFAGAREPTPRPRGLSAGLHAEVTLRNAELDWLGKADLITISDHACEIADFKTGMESDSHILQVRIYALLWARDRRVNPNGRLATRLALIYRSSVVDVPAPTVPDLAALAEEVEARTRAVHVALSLSPRAATPARGVCELCGVRQLCGRYWEPSTRAILADPLAPLPAFADAEIVTRGKQGPLSWRAVVNRGAAAAPGTEVLVRIGSDSLQFASLFEAGRTLRILDARCIPMSDESAGLTALSLGAWSEVYVA
jgi:hypothetical protein